jgi:hypothetical protein
MLRQRLDGRGSVKAAVLGFSCFGGTLANSVASRGKGGEEQDSYTIFPFGG